ncbi:(2,3-dihydroxybenzoyl)adenylate synthase [Spongiactinospora sp. 9N601]|uniref:(2,3-dihydroxybenzoyl)adenylate synthase n=1 Tax=Spongiactinospora sp. 9N601 TaxID=3375149 RepID=UPI0037B76282
MTADVVPYPDHLARAYREAGAWRPHTIPGELRLAARRWPDTLAVVTATERVTYRELDRRADRLAVALRRLGLAPGDPVVFQLANEAHTVVAYYGVLRAGLVPICSLAQHRAREIGYLIRHTGARAHLVEADFRDYDLPGFAAAMAAEHESVTAVVVFGGPAREGQHAYADLVAGVDADVAAEEVGTWPVDPASVAVFQLSGGTTGDPKVIPRLHCEYAYNARAWAEHWNWGPETVVLHAGPMMHNAGIVVTVQSAHLTGATVVLVPRIDAEAIAEAVARERVTDTMMGVGLLTRLAEHPRLGRFDFSSLRRVFFAPSIPSACDQAEKLLGCRVVPLFGAGEGIFLTAPDDAPEQARKATCGAPLSPLDEVRLLNPGTEEEVAPGEIGELVARGPYTIHGYYRAPERNLAAFTSDGFYRTGDLARAHLVEGVTYYSHEGRITDNISRGGEKIHADELEGLLAGHPGIAEVAVVGMPDRLLGERVCAFVRPAKDHVPTVAELADFLLGLGLAKFKLPERVEIVDELPRTKVGKVSKRDLRDRINALVSREQGHG